MHTQHNQIVDVNPSTEYKLHNLYKERRLALSYSRQVAYRVSLRATKIIFYAVFRIYLVNIKIIVKNSKIKWIDR